MNLLRRVVIANQLALLAIFVLGWLYQHPSALGLAVAGVIALPLLLPLRGLIRGHRRSYAATTLYLLPYLIIGITESVANPDGRASASLGVIWVLVQFGTLIAYLRVTRGLASDGPAPGVEGQEPE